MANTLKSTSRSYSYLSIAAYTYSAILRRLFAGRHYNTHVYKNCVDGESSLVQSQVTAFSLAIIAQDTVQHSVRIAHRCLSPTGACRHCSRNIGSLCSVPAEGFRVLVSIALSAVCVCVCVCLCARAGDPRKNNTSFRVQFFARSDFAQMRVPLPFGDRPRLPDTVPCIRAGATIRCPPFVSNVA